MEWIYDDAFATVRGGIGGLSESLSRNLPFKLSKLDRARVDSRTEFPRVSHRFRVKMLIRAKVQRAGCRTLTKPCKIPLHSRRLLYSVLPISVANELRHSRPVPAKKYDCVTLLFSGIVGFGAYCAAHTDSNGAMKIVNMLNELYTAFDVLTDPKKNPNVYKVKL